MNETTSKIIKIGKKREENGVNVSLNDRRLGKVETYRYLRVDMWSGGGMAEEVKHRKTEPKKTWGILKDVWKKKHISREAK